MPPDLPEMFLRLLSAIVAGLVIGYERSYRGRPAGFRTHALVCMASALLMIASVREGQWIAANVELTEIDPLRMAQGIMTGIGFLGAGAILKEGLSVRGLTTAASIWITAAIGILAGLGSYAPLIMSVALTLVVLSALGWIESRMSAHTFFHFDVRFAAQDAMSEAALRDLVGRHGFSMAQLSYEQDGQGPRLRYGMIIRTRDGAAAGRLASALRSEPAVEDFRITPRGE